MTRAPIAIWMPRAPTASNMCGTTFVSRSPPVPSRKGWALERNDWSRKCGPPGETRAVLLFRLRRETLDFFLDSFHLGRLVQVLGQRQHLLIDARQIGIMRKFFQKLP